MNPPYFYLKVEAECERGEGARQKTGARVCSRTKWLYLALGSGNMLMLNTHKLGHLQHSLPSEEASTVEARGRLYIDVLCD